MTPPSSSSLSTILTSITRPALSRLTLLTRHFSTPSQVKMTKSFKVAKISDLKDGQMKEIEIPGAEGSILLSRVQGSFYATGNKCTRIFPSWFGGGACGVDFC